MATKSIFLVGAPTFSSLQWDENELLGESVPPFENPQKQSETSQVFPQVNRLKWRLLPGLVAPESPQTKEFLNKAGEGQFFRVQDLAMSVDIQNVAHEDSGLTRFYDHSFTVHETSELSISGAASEESVLDSGLWTESTESSLAANERDTPAVQPHLHGNVTHLQDIPSAEYLESIMPQTITVNLIVGILDIRPPRRIVTRQWKRELDLVEAVVGDETRTGFGITFWLPPSHDSAASRGCGDTAGEELRGSLKLLRPLDIVLLRTVGLSCFRNRVYGQSLRRGLTKIDLLYRQQVDATDTGGIYRLRDILNHASKDDDLPLLKVRKVHEWIRRFIPEAGAAGGKSRSSRTVALPPDSQGMT